jgi:hypothetical protein
MMQECAEALEKMFGHGFSPFSYGAEADAASYAA